MPLRWGSSCPIAGHRRILRIHSPPESKNRAKLLKCVASVGQPGGCSHKRDGEFANSYDVMKWSWPKIWADERGGWWRVALTLMLFVTGMLLGDLLILVSASAGLNDKMKHLPLYFQQMVRPLAIFVASSFALAGCLSGVRFVHHKPVACVFTDGRPFRVIFALQSAAFWLVLWFASALLLPDRCERLAQRTHELPWAGLVSLSVVMLCATSVQGTLEEIVFRGYLQPRVGAWVKHTWVAMAIVGVIFTIVHFDAWTAPGIVYVAGFSAAFGIGGIRTGSIAPLCGLHAAHNAMEFLWFPHESNTVTTWPMTGTTVAALAVWLVWLFWTTRPRPATAFVSQ